ncbi:MAG TPA: ABC transporter permease [Candidatus Acidoferrales bacterium]|nr:ABC transporter permease [Candidatus Acidoferrales bacterium]
MIQYLVRRLAWGLAVLGAVLLITFVLTYVLPADPARMIAGPSARPADVTAIRHALGLDRGFFEQLGTYIGNILHGDFGFSYHQHRPVLGLLLERFPATAQLAVAGLVIELAIGLPLGVMAATRRGSWWDRWATIFTIVLVSAPSFWVGYLLLELVFQGHQSAGIDILPLGGGYKPFDLRYLFLPALTLGFGGAAYYNRLMRATMLDELHRDYVRTARAKGLGEPRVLWRHALRNAIGPVLIQVGLDLGFFLGGVVVVEQVFSWPGIGKLAVDSIATADVPLIIGTVVFGTLCIVLANLFVDILNAVTDPRIRF